ncbi:MAG: RNA polymerase sigma factor [Eubacterium sp.]|nr:RNA polymerase sigma factor [Eubacterium sp.]
MNKKVADEEVEQTIIEYSDLLYKICFLILKDDSDVQDVLQETFIKYMTKSPDFESEDHKKAWLIKVSQNKCKEFLRFHKRHAAVPLEEVEESFSVTDGMDTDTSSILSLIWNLKYKLKSVVILYYIEGYKVNEVARILGISESAVKKRLERARKELRIAKDVEGEIAYERI